MNFPMLIAGMSNVHSDVADPNDNSNRDAGQCHEVQRFDKALGEG